VEPGESSVEPDGAGVELDGAGVEPSESSVELDGASAVLSWPGAATPGAARLNLPAGLRWSLHRGGVDPILGWYSGGLGQRVPTFTLIGRGRSAGDMVLATRLAFLGLDITQPVNIKPYHGYSLMPEGAGRAEEMRGGQ
jgi:hypothetical protein